MGACTMIRSGSTPETMRALGYRTVDLLVDCSATRRAAAPARHAGGDARAARPGRPGGPKPFADVLGASSADVLPFRAACDHPAFFAFIPCCGTWPGALGDFIASAANVYAARWMESAGPSQVELEVLGWFKEWIGYPPTAAGILVSGGSAANMTALACARESLVGADVRRPRRLRLRPGALLARAGGSRPRLPTRPGARAARRRGLHGSSPARSPRRSKPTGPPAAGRSSSPSSGGSTSTGAIDPLPRSPRSAASAARGCTSTPPTAASRR